MLLDQSLDVVLSFSQRGQTAHQKVAGEQSPFDIVGINILSQNRSTEDVLGSIPIVPVIEVPKLPLLNIIHKSCIVGWELVINEAGAAELLDFAVVALSEP